MILQPVVTGRGSGSASADARYGVELTGSYDGSNRIFEFPEGVLHSPPNQAVRLYHGGRRMKHREYAVFESVPLSGVYNRVRLTEFAPNATSVLFADYQAA